LLQVDRLMKGIFDFMAVKLFLCYADEDKDLVAVLRKHLKLLEQSSCVDKIWDSEVPAGYDVHREREKRLDESQVILLLLSTGFMNSTYCHGVAMRQALRRQEQGEALVVPILLQSVYWEDALIGKLQVLPRNGRAISEWDSQDEAFVDVVRDLKKAIEEWEEHSLLHPTEERKQFLVVLSQFIKAVREQLQDVGRADNTASTLQDLSELIPQGVTLADLAAGWKVLSQVGRVDEGPVVSRRKTCAEFVGIAAQFTSEQGNLKSAVKTWQKWAETYKNKEAPEKRHLAMAKTFARELSELQEAARLL